MKNTIFGYAKINHMFRCWHDYIHITQNFSFDEIGEKNTAIYQKNQLPINWAFERELILIEVSGQVDYFVKNNRFYFFKLSISFSSSTILSWHFFKRAT